MPRPVSALCLLLVMLLHGSVTAQPLWESLNKKVISDHIIPNYLIFKKAAETFNAETVSFCTAPTAQSQAKLRKHFLELNNSWMNIQHLRYGPVEDNQAYYRIQLYPDKRNAVGKHLAVQIKSSDLKKLKPARFQRLSVALQGISALEHLLYSDRYPLQTFVSTEETASFNCGLVRAIGQNLHNISNQLYDEWTSDQSAYALLSNEKKFPLRGNDQEKALQARTEVTSLLYSGYSLQIQLILEHKLMRPLNKSIKKAKPHFSEARFSKNSLQNIVINLQSLEKMFDITYAPLLDIKKQGPELHKEIKAVYAKAIAQAKNIKTPLVQAVKSPDHRPKVEELLETIKQLNQLTTGPMVETLVIPMRFNAMDGD